MHINVFAFNLMCYCGDGAVMVIQISCLAFSIGLIQGRDILSWNKNIHLNPITVFLFSFIHVSSYPSCNFFLISSLLTLVVIFSPPCVCCILHFSSVKIAFSCLIASVIYYCNAESLLLFQAVYYIGLGIWIAFMDVFTGHHRSLDSIFKYQVQLM